LSLFSGIGGFEQGLHDVYPASECVGYSEVDKYAIHVYQRHYPNHINLGDISKIDIASLPDFDLIFGGFPCQDLSIAKNNRKGLGGKRSGLFWVMMEIVRIKQPKWFLFENVASMPQADKHIISRAITEATGYSNKLLLDECEPVMINAALVSAQNRKRLFWCNWHVEQPEDRGILLKEVLEHGQTTDKDKSRTIRTSGMWSGYGNKYNWDMIKITAPIHIGQLGKGGQGDRVYSVEGKSVNLSANGGGRGAKTRLYLTDENIRKLTPIECERLQCFPDYYTDGISNNQRYKCLGNAVNVEVVKHLFKEAQWLELPDTRLSQMISRRIKWTQ
jgi:DNA (cytosine-5)-methyltransferase 3A